MEAFSIDLRVRVLADYDLGLSTSEIAAKQRVSESWARRLRQRWQETGEIAARPAGPAPAKKLAGREDRLRAHVEAQPDATLEEIRRTLDLPVALSTLWRTLRALGLTLKKGYGRPSKRARTSRPDAPNGTPGKSPWIRRGGCFSMRPGPPRRSPGRMGAAAGADASAVEPPQGIGRRPPSCPRSGPRAWSPPWSWMAPSPGRCSRPMLNNPWPRRSDRATRW
jgi:transposase